MIEGVVGSPLLLEVALADGVETRFPRARIYDAAGVFQIDVDLTHTADGFYQGLWTAGPAAQYVAHYTVFSDAPRTVVDPSYDRVLDHIQIRALDQDFSFQKLLGHLGENMRDDVLTYDINSRPLTMRRRIFATKAAALASTPGSTGEGEILTITVAAAHIDAAKWETLVMVREP